MTDNLPQENRVILLVDGDQQHCERVRRLFEHQAGQTDASHSGGTKVVVAEGLQAARQALKTLVPQIVIANLQLPDGDGLELLTREASQPYPVLITSDAHGERPAIRALKAGAIDYVVKSASAVAALPKTVESALYEWHILAEHQRLQAEVVEIPQREQQRLGRELHDGLGQELTGLGLLARSLAKRLVDASPREREMAEQLATGLEQTLAEVRILARGLIPVQTDALGLVSALEENGIGRPSTYAPIMGKLVQRGYVTRDNRRLVPTRTGFIVNDLVSEYFSSIVDTSFTAEMEEELDLVASGEKDWRESVREFYGPFADQLEYAREEMPEIEPVYIPVDKKCPECGGELVQRWGRYGLYVGCSNHPECQHTERWVKKIGVTCPEDGGELIERKTKKGRIFYGCENYPECDFASWKKPLPQPCPNCGGLLVDKNKKRAECIECSLEFSKKKIIQEG